MDNLKIIGKTDRILEVIKPRDDFFRCEDAKRMSKMNTRPYVWNSILSPAFNSTIELEMQDFNTGTIKLINYN